MGGSVATS